MANSKSVKNNFNFWERSPFLGLLPNSLVLIEIDFMLSNSKNLKEYFYDLITELKNYESKFQLRWHIGFSKKFFKRFKIQCPLDLINLKLNGDKTFTFEESSGKSDGVICFGGSWDKIVSAARLIKEKSKNLSIKPIAINIGHHEETERDHSGFLDGTSNLQELSEDLFSKCVFVQKSDDEKTMNGSYLMFRKYKEDLEMWNDLQDFVQEHFIGRKKNDGTFLDNKKQWNQKTWKSTPQQAHIRLANPRNVDTNHPNYWKERIFRRGIKYSEKNESGTIDYGLLFLALVRNPKEQFVRIHNERLFPKKNKQDFLLTSGYISPLRSSCFFLPENIDALIRLVSDTKKQKPI